MRNLYLTSLFIMSFIFGIFLSSSATVDFDLKTTKTNIKKWEKSKLTYDSLRFFVNDKNCKKNEKNKQACIGALVSLLKEGNLTIEKNGKIVRLDDFYSEKETLESWKNIKVDFSFNSKIDEIEIISDKHSIPFLVSNGINGFLSIKQDPHSQIFPSEKPSNKEVAGSLFFTINRNLKDPSIIKLEYFGTGTCNFLKTKIKELNKKKIKNLVLDLSGNRGGFVYESACIAGLFIGKKFIVKLEEFNGEFSNIVSSENKIYHQKLTVLVDENSASASEILAGVLKLNKRAKIIGKRTFGKGTFQREAAFLIPGLNLKYMKTKGFFYFKDGSCPQLIGISPDIENKEPDEFQREEDMYFSPLKKETT